MNKPKIYTFSFTKIYQAYLDKALKKMRTKGEVNEIIMWLTGHTELTLEEQLMRGIDVETFFNEVPLMNPLASEIKGVICGCRVEEIEDPIMKKIRMLDKLIDELAKGRPLTKILRK